MSMKIFLRHDAASFSKGDFGYGQCGHGAPCPYGYCCGPVWKYQCSWLLAPCTFHLHLHLHLLPIKAGYITCPGIKVDTYEVDILAVISVFEMVLLLFYLRQGITLAIHLELEDVDVESGVRSALGSCPLNRLRGTCHRIYLTNN